MRSKSLLALWSKQIGRYADGKSANRPPLRRRNGLVFFHSGENHPVLRQSMKICLRRSPRGSCPKAKPNTLPDTPSGPGAVFLHVIRLTARKLLLCDSLFVRPLYTIQLRVSQSLLPSGKRVETILSRRGSRLSVSESVHGRSFMTSLYERLHDWRREFRKASFTLGLLPCWRLYGELCGLCDNSRTLPLLALPSSVLRQRARVYRFLGRMHSTLRLGRNPCVANID